MDEVALYNLYHSASCSARSSEIEAKKYAENLMIIHLHFEHNMGIRLIAKRFNRKIIEIKKVLYP